MPAKSGASHGIAAFTTLLLGTILSKFVRTLFPPVGELSLLVVRTIADLGLPVPTDEAFAGTLVVVVTLSFLWGVAYHVSRH